MSIINSKKPSTFISNRPLWISDRALIRSAEAFPIQRTIMTDLMKTDHQARRAPEDKKSYPYRIKYLIILLPWGKIDKSTS